MATSRYYRWSVLSLLAAMPCAAQSVASLAVNAGAATDVTGAGANALTVAPSFSRGSALSSASLTASGTRFANEAWSLGLTTGVSARATQKAVAPAIDVAAGAATTSYDFSYASIDLIPSVDARAGASRFFVGTRLSAAGASASVIAPTPGLTPLPERSATRSSTAGTLLGGVNITSVGKDGEVSSLGYRGEVGTVAGNRLVEHSVNGSVAGARVALAGAVGRRAYPGQASTYASASLGIAATRSVMVQIAAGSYPSNPMIGMAAGRFVNAGLVMRLGRGAPSVPDPADVPAPARGFTRIAIRASDARRVEIGGDFNKWQLSPAIRASNGVWYVDLALPPGEYRYAFRIDGKEWRVPEGVAAADDEFGGKTAWLTVDRTATGRNSK
jgi:hypothetical protein